ncbi:MAG: LapA family protein [Variovorax sp.]|nr:LapA family protein [Variovorax sp.]
MTRYLYIALIVIVAGIVLLFKVQNLETVTVSLLSMSVTLPVSVLILVVYVLGMFTGGFVLGLLRSWTHKATAR